MFGADLPGEGNEQVRFEWRDGPFLKALRRGDWIVLDEVISNGQYRPFYHGHIHVVYTANSESQTNYHNQGMEQQSKKPDR